MCYGRLAVMEKEPKKKRGRPVGSKSGVNFVNRHFRIPDKFVEAIKEGGDELSVGCRMAISNGTFKDYGSHGKTVRIHVMIRPEQDKFLESNSLVYGTKSKALASLIAGHLYK